MAELEGMSDEDWEEYCEECCEADEWRWEPSCARDCEICGCHGDCPDCDPDYEDYSDEGVDTEK